MRLQTWTEDIVVIEIQLDELLKKRERSFYWLAKETGISYTTLWRLKKGRALGINFVTLEKVCEALMCQPGDVLSISATGHNTGKAVRNPARKKASIQSARASKQ